VGVAARDEGTVVVRAFEARDQQAARNVILEGMREHWGTLDLTLNRDLDDIELSYADGVFVVAECDGRLIATGAMVPREEESCEIVRMSTLRDYRRQGIARRVLRMLLREAKAHGYAHVRLATNADWSDAIAFYEKFGMIRVPDARQPGAAFFELTL
jgi:ribosomal protein S18 acetylase RimI-like enzyme